MALWTLADLPATRLWYDALTRQDATGVSQLTDKSGNDTHLTQATTTAQPPVSSAAVNGLDAILFNNSAHFLSNTPAVPVGQTEFTLVSVWKTGTPQSYAAPPINLVASPDIGRPLDRWQSTISNRVYINGMYAAVGLSIRAATSVFVHAIQVKKDGHSTGQHTVVEMADGVVINSVYITVAWSTVGQQIRLGRRIDGTTIFNGLFCEAALIEGAVSVDDLQKVEGYLAWKWGTVSRLQASHPYKDTAPIASGQELLVVGDGGAVSGGAGTVEKGISRTSTGGAVVSGVATILTEFQSLLVEGVGGAVAGGSAGVVVTAPPFVGGIDGYVQLLIHSNTTDSSFVFADSSFNPTDHVITRYGGVSHQTEYAKFGTSSIKFDTNDYLTVVDNNNVDYAFGTGDWQFDFWCTVPATGTNQILISLDGGSWYLMLDTTRKLKFYNSTIGTSGSLFTDGPYLDTVNTFYHIAISHISGTTRMFVDGTVYAAQADSHNYGNLPIYFGRYFNGSYPFSGYMDEIRISKGIGRYAESFTPMTAAYTPDPIYISGDFVGFVPNIYAYLLAPPSPIYATFNAPLPRVSATMELPAYIWGNFVAPMPRVYGEQGMSCEFVAPMPHIEGEISNPALIYGNFAAPAPSVSSTVEQYSIMTVEYRAPLPKISGSFFDISFIEGDFQAPLPRVSGAVGNEIIIDGSFGAPMPRVTSEVYIPEAFEIIKYRNTAITCSN